MARAAGLAYIAIVLGATGLVAQDTLLKSGLTHFQAGDCDAAVRELTEYLKAQPKSTPALTMLGVCLSMLRRFPEAETVLERSLSLEPKQVLALKQLGWLHYEMGRLEQAEEALAKALALKPSDPETYYALANVKEALREFPACAAMARRSLDLAAPARPAATLHLLGACLLKSGQPDEAEAAITPAESSVEMLYLMADIKFNQRDYAASAELARRVLRQRPDVATAELLLGLSLVELGDYAGAEAAYGRAVKLAGGPGHPRGFQPEKLYESFGQLMLILDRLEEAKAWFDRALTLDPDYVPALLGRARARQRKNQPREAMTDAEKALRLEPDSQTAHVLLLQIYLALGLQDKAKPVAEWLEAQNDARLKGEQGKK